MIKKILTAAAVLVLASGPAFAGSCPKDMKQVDAMLSKATNLSASKMAQIKDLRAKGESLHKAGKHAESVAVLHKAKAMLGM